MMSRLCERWAVLFVLAVVGFVSAGADWPQFRGPGGTGVCDQGVLTEWSDSEGIAWKTALPGAGSSSPILAGDRVFVTCYSGYGIPGEERGAIADLKRHLICLDRKSGDVLWQKTVDAEMPEDVYSGMGVPEHGYASNTPAVDGERVYVFFAKTGVLAFDLEGNELWRVSVGQESGNRRWGSAASLMLYDDLVIVNASEESQSVRGLEKATGKEVWKAEAAMLELTYATPLLVDSPGVGPQLVLGVPGEVWGLHPKTGKLQWYAAVPMGGNISPCPVESDGVVVVSGGYPKGGTAAVRLGGKDDVTESHGLWESTDSTYVPSPVAHQGRVHWVSDQGIAFCLDAKTGEAVYRERLPRMSATGRGKPIYASVIVAGEHLYAVSRTAGTYVLDAGAEFNVVAHNVIESDKSRFHGTPAVCCGQLFLRSDRFLYCLGEETGN
jgi:outer membrane protein assembly factor BamB